MFTLKKCVINNENDDVPETIISDTEELAADMMSLLASFSGKFYGKRSAERRKKNKTIKK